MKKVANLIGIALIVLAFLAMIQKPGPGPGPGPVKGLRVIFVYESNSPLTKDQLAVRDSPKIADYLDKHCEGGKDGWKRWDKDVDTSKADKLWQEIWAEAKPKLGELPQIVIVSGQKGKCYPFPKDPDAGLEFFQKFGGK